MDQRNCKTHEHEKCRNMVPWHVKSYRNSEVKTQESLVKVVWLTTGKMYEFCVDTSVSIVVIDKEFHRIRVS